MDQVIDFLTGTCIVVVGLGVIAAIWKAITNFDGRYRKGRWW